MCPFKAFTVEDDTEAKEINDCTTLEEYYKKIIRDALNIKVELVFTDLTDLEIKLTNGLYMHYLCTIRKDESQAKDAKTLIRKLSEEEDKYYYKWIEEEEESKDLYKTIVLNKLRRANVSIYTKIYESKGKTGSQITTLFKQIEAQNPKQENETQKRKTRKQLEEEKEGKNDKNSRCFFAILIESEDNIFIRINKEARPLFLDTEDTSTYKYVRIDNKYAPALTAQIDTGSSDIGPLKQDITGHNPLAKFADELDERIKITLGLPTKQAKVYDEIHNYKDLEKAKGEILEYLNISEENGIINKIIEENEIINKIILAIEKYKNNESKDEKDKGKYKEGEIRSIIEAAYQNASALPANYKCFYYEEGNELKSFISSVSISTGAGGSGYAMRADKINEVDYRWTIPHEIGSENYHLAKLLSYIIGLDSNKFFLNNNDNIEKISKDYHRTNWEIARKLKRGGDKSSESLIHYYKKFKDDAVRRNKPIGKEDILAPRKFTQTKDNKKEIKLDNKNYRKHQKGNKYSGITYTPKNQIKQRLDAGTVMAGALNQFEIYTELQNKNKKIKGSKLSATLFTEAVIEIDKKVKPQWIEDKNNEENSKDDDGKATLKTDQEWCHLFGHGDGGEEELGNFVSGSKHCNTEQLAIEVGQRRVTQNSDIDNDKIRNNIKAKITAYLMPNCGTYRKNIFTKDEIANLLFPEKKYQDIKKAFFKEGDENIKGGNEDILSCEKFFDSANDEKTKYSVKAYSLIDKNLNAILEKIKSIKNDKKANIDDKEAYRQFYKNFTENFFVYLPLARWIRYKVYYDNLKVFDHIFDAQSQSFNVHEAAILDYTVERAIYLGMKERKVKVQIKNPDYISSKSSDMDTSPLDDNSTKQNKTIDVDEYYRNKIEQRVKDTVPNIEEAKVIDLLLTILNEFLEANNNNKKLDKSKVEELNNKKARINNTINMLDKTTFNYPMIESFMADINKINLTPKRESESHDNTKAKKRAKKLKDSKSKVNNKNSFK